MSEDNKQRLLEALGKLEEYEDTICMSREHLPQSDGRVCDEGYAVEGRAR